MFKSLRWLCLLSPVLSAIAAPTAAQDDRTVRVFIFAGQSNMVGSHSKAEEIARFPPFAGLDEPQSRVRFHYCIGRETKAKSDGWVDLQPINGIVGPELSFGRKVSAHVEAPIAIIKCAAGGTDLGGDWNPDQPSGFKLYPFALQRVREALEALDRQRVRYRIEGFMWHQGENDMFDDANKANYGNNLANFIASWRRDLDVPELRFYVGELSTKTIWGMDLRPSMYAISLGQRAVTEADPLADYVPTSHTGVKIGDGVGLHYHYGTLGQLEHGDSYAQAYLTHIGKAQAPERPLDSWPYPEGSKVTLCVLAGHRNMEGERAFVQQLRALRGKASLGKDDHSIAFRYDLGGGYRVSAGWEPLGPAGSYDTFGPELSFGASLRRAGKASVAIAKFTHSGSQVVDWTPEGSEAKSRNLYERFIAFVNAAVEDLENKGHEVELAGIFYHLGENDMSWAPFRSAAATRLRSLVEQSRVDLERPALRWFVSQQEPTDDEQLNRMDPVAAVAAVAEADPQLIHLTTFELPGREEQLVLSTAGIVALGERLAECFLKQ